MELTDHCYLTHYFILFTNYHHDFQLRWIENLKCLCLFLFRDKIDMFEEKLSDLQRARKFERIFIDIQSVV